MKTHQNWEERANLGNFYQGENFYTITPLPLYIKRREILLNLLTPYVSKAKTICDLGCGDGWYMHYFQTQFKETKVFTGIDASKNMLVKARLLNPTVFLYQSNTGLSTEGSQFQLIYTIAMLAHIDDKSLKTIAQSVFQNLDNKGNYVIFEQVAPNNYTGKSFVRRTIGEYENIFQQVGFEVEQKTLVRFRFHQFFEKNIAKYYYKFFCEGKDDYEKRINANSHLLFILMSKLFLLADKKHLIYNGTGGWGNLFMSLVKRI